MKKTKIIVGAVLLLLGIACLVFSIVSLLNGLPTEGRMAGNIYAFQASYPYELLVIVCTCAAGLALLPIGVAITAFGMKTRD